MQLFTDPYNAFLDHSDAAVEHAASGPLSGLKLAVKDIFDIAGHRMGCGSPQRLAEAEPAAKTATAIQKMLDAGAAFVGRTQTEELAFSLTGQNAHYPYPINPVAPDRVTGGSSSGSVAAVAAGLADIAAGSDTGGSIRAPASFCGLIGLRPTHGVISLEGAMPLAPSLDAFGWFARDAATYETVGRLFFEETPSFSPRPIHLEMLDTLLLGPAEKAAYGEMVSKIAETVGTPMTALWRSMTSTGHFVGYRPTKHGPATAHGSVPATGDLGRGSRNDSSSDPPSPRSSFRQRPRCARNSARISRRCSDRMVSW
jgi:amidase